MTGIDAPYEPPETPEVHLKSDEQTPDVLADQVIAYLESAGILSEKL
jgi:bifunctional enzyme CysN/CysC